MSVGRAQSHLASAPGLVRRWLENVCGLRNGAYVELVDPLYIQVCDVTVIPEFNSRHCAGAAAEHESHGSGPAEGPVAGIGVCSLASKHTRVPARRSVEIMDGEDRVRADNPHT